MELKLFLTGLFLILGLCSAYIVHPGPNVIATKGEVWPKPLQMNSSEKFFVLRRSNFSFQVNLSEIGCPDLLEAALVRYWGIIQKYGDLERRGRLFEAANKSEKKSWLRDDNFLGYLEELKVTLDGECSDSDYPTFEIAENYSLSIDVGVMELRAPTVWGLLRGLETFSQLFYMDDDVLKINETAIVDMPQFPHRGILLDTSRHFLPLYSILETLDAMAYNKFNVFHWHIVDDQSFPYKSEAFPELSAQGAYHPVSRIYDRNDIRKVVEYARQRGIRVIPEFDTPGHTRSWGISHPEVLTDCSTLGKPGDYGPMDPSNPAVYELLQSLFGEVFDLFPDSHFHAGGDEVDFDCWEKSEKISDFMVENNITSYANLEGYFIRKVLDILDNLKAKYLVWEEVFTNGVQLPNSTLVHVWKSGGNDTLAEVTKSGKSAIYSSCWYLDYLQTGGDWERFYNCSPLDFEGSEDQKKLVMGGEACLWGESVNEYNLTPRLWPRASAVAEKLWSNGSFPMEEVSARLEEHTCRMNHRGIAAQPPNGPGVCL